MKGVCSKQDVCVSPRGYGNMVKQANFVNNGNRKIEYGLLDGRKEGEHKCLGFVEMSGRCVMRDTFYLK